MSLNLNVPDRPTELRPHILVFGVGGAGGNAVNNMIRSNLEGVDCIVANTDAQALSQSLTERRLQLGRTITQGLGAGSRPDIGRAAAEEGLDEIVEALQDVHMVFIAAGMGGGTGTGAAPVIARASREQGILTVGVITKPFHFEGPNRMRIAEAGLDELQQHVDTMIVIPNQNLFRVATDKTTFAEAFRMADDVLYSGVRGVTDLMVMPGLINLDFADIRTVMSEMGKAMMGAGEAEGEERSREAAEAAISNPLLDDVSMNGARGVLINITGGPDMTLYEVDEAVNRVRDEVDANANLIFGSTFDEELAGRIRVSIFATGIEADAAAMPGPTNIRIVARNARGKQPATRPETAIAAEPVAAPLAGAPAPAGLPVTEPEAAPQDLPDPAGDPETAWELSGDLPEAVIPAVTATAAMAPVSAPPFFAGSEAPDLDQPPAADDLPELPDLPPASEMFDEFPAPLPAIDFDREVETTREPSGGATNPYAMPAQDDGGPGRRLGRPALDAGRRLLRALRRRDEEESDNPSAESRGDGPAPLPGLEPGAPGKTAGEEADLLEIPAFLRRQAN